MDGLTQMIFNTSMKTMMFCGGGKPSIPSMPKESPRPTIEPTSSDPAGQSRQKRTEQYRSGFASTIKTSPVGLQDENNGGGKKTLGS